MGTGHFGINEAFSMHKKSSSTALPETLYSPEAEQSVLGGLMLDNDRWDEVARRYYRRRILFQSASGNLEENGRPVSDKQPDRFNHPQWCTGKDGVLERVGALLIWRNYPKHAQCVRILSAMRKLSWIAAVPGSDLCSESAGHPECGGSGKYSGVMWTGWTAVVSAVRKGLPAYSRRCSISFK